VGSFKTVISGVGHIEASREVFRHFRVQIIFKCLEVGLLRSQSHEENLKCCL
jgi:hypothetical protein